MRTGTTVTETRLVTGFNRVVLAAPHSNELIITQGNREALTIEGPADLVPRLVTDVRHRTLYLGTGGGLLEKVKDALTTSLTRPHIRFCLAVREIAAIEVSAMAQVRAAAVKAGELRLKFHGAGELRIDSLLADRLEVEQSGMGRVELAGHVTQQRVSLFGSGHFQAPELESHEAQVTVKGMGSAVVWATRDLLVTVRGTGQVSYYGAPRLSGSVAPLGSLVSLGAHGRLCESMEGSLGAAR
ncbi:MAG TPA: DUF2807 domain-containing protein [Anaerolineae bacterium]|nr:DUF2807 domain-containing protein [Anaerolineae bacterium]